ncbi:MAG: aminotransferase class I/II-fold pyridoxal phosphate-dependent enzyme [Eubacterium sp.]|nr:aminotransferase class I/II-fold pyridoxal phosphate-dependent enzyme [Eubacterium sp.]
MNTPIYHHLKKLITDQRIPFHMPGHKRKKNTVYGEAGKIDITEITGYDNLHHPEGIIRQSMDQLKQIYGSRESWYLVNGSTVGILASISAVCRPGDKILIQRNCHKAVYNAIRLLHLQSFYICPEENIEYDISMDMEEKEREEIRKILKREPDIKAIVVTSPTYEGIVTDIRKLKKVIQEENENIILIVDEAHGAHMIFDSYFPESAVKCGGDLVIQSAHKTLPSLTQSALLHLCTDKISPEKIQDMLSVYETSSPSYLLMMSAEYGVMYMHKKRKKVLEYVDNLKNFREQCGQLKHICLLDKKKLGCFDYDGGKLVFSVKNSNIEGKMLFHKLLEEYHIELEMENISYVVAMTSVMDETEDFEKLFQALKEIDNCMEKREKAVFHYPLTIPEKKAEIWECEEIKREKIILSEAAGRTVGSYIMLYPPGIPLLVPGEKIVKEMVENISYYLYNGYNVLGLENGMISVLCE